MGQRLTPSSGGSRYEIADRYQGDTLLTAGTPAFWDQQLADLGVATDRLTAHGATLVVVLTEPRARGWTPAAPPSDCHPFLRRMVTQDVLRLHWNELVRQRAAIDARIKVITVDDIACPRGPRPLCDDTLASPGHSPVQTAPTSTWSVPAIRSPPRSSHGRWPPRDTEPRPDAAR